MNNTTLSLDLSDVRLEYLAEGAANIVYRIFPPDAASSSAADWHSEPDGYDSDTPLPTEINPLQLDPRLQGKLVRLRKSLPSTVPIADSQRHFENQIRPLFRPENLVEAILFHPSPALLKECNAQLRLMERTGTRPPKRHGIYLVETEAHGCLITDMGNPPPSRLPSTSEYKCLEFKPKWLVQSPSAPAGARRCRTCALRAMKLAERVSTSPSALPERETAKTAFCPLNLVSIDRDKLSIFVDHILGLSPRRNRSADDPKTAKEYKLLMRFLYRNPLLDRLRTLQLQLDTEGVFKADLLSSKFLAAMTLRDCTMFLKVPLTNGKEIEARLGDLDLKTSSGKKGEYWSSLERRLIDEGWYAATEKDSTIHTNLCQLS